MAKFSVGGFLRATSVTPPHSTAAGWSIFQTGKTEAQKGDVPGWRGRAAGLPCGSRVPFISHHITFSVWVGACPPLHKIRVP